MKIGLIGLGKMGYNLALNLSDHGHTVIGTDASSVEATTAFEIVPTLKDVVDKLEAPRVVWAMVPAGDITETVLTELFERLEPGDIVIDGGNSNYKLSVARAEQFAEKNISFFDCGTSGGTDGARNGACTMVGGDAKAWPTIEPIFKDLSVENGYLYTGPAGSGHFLKMIHNGIEYGMMQAIAEGFDILEKSPFDYDYEQVARVWNHGSVVRSWLMELTENAFKKDAKLDEIRGVMHSSGEGKWTVETALELQAAAPVIAMSLMMRYRSLEDDTFSGKVVAALRNEFGGHAVVKK
ncbi:MULTISPECIES: phosphogluconate dehydrogenase (NAD(+)-dependent, decarboxylating) [Exiguobacterium]|uniref:phosphogluconate dehydrogenase (NAD(+)-dependent, decarboxylating) n=1 Tax=Exiguobacterium TaxID=33986 RepID=UPI0008776FED|nr:MULTISPECIES: decarboxylating 6-phosphogluconate dehydrogenase [Exiguobacterium]TCI48304.1 decarboxylating 6-phosphogluconate dehydrogenase [Exiguobacterium sp. SH5S32]TCI52124.1 decarboxylating 6-phosphogluconate dehydrogenase [Exiguobacterium sp. SH5S13]TCI55191.1 decarboxylating 6-phosphogluconate dehydrogenase [Exiguobacterium sp. SH1S4]TCI74984.1 decarboxylating 6-phosphogluconate dehydrogenase [Exiguobacterium sp. SH1S1]